MLPLFVYTETHSRGNFAVYRTYFMSYKRQNKKIPTILKNNSLFSKWIFGKFFGKNCLHPRLWGRVYLFNIKIQRGGNSYV